LNSHRMFRGLLSVVLAVAAVGCGAAGRDSGTADAADTDHPAPAIEGVRPPAPGEAVATFAGGCFWCMEVPFEKLEGVHAVISGYMGGTEKNPTYEEVGSGRTGHAESVEILYDPARITYERLLEVFWHNVDPTTADGQFCDHGHQYRPAIFYQDSSQKAQAQASFERTEKTKTFAAPLVVEITKATPFYPAEEYHQDFYKKNPVRYHSYRLGCGRDRRLKELWGDDAGH
jgi:peptide-methionine (S)-S-oxide reductase